MTNESLKTDVLTALTEYHEDITEFTTRIRQLAMEIGSGDHSWNAEAFRQYFEDELTLHFKFEEQVVFPALEAAHINPRVPNMLFSLTQTHKQVLDKAAQIYETLVRRSMSEIKDSHNKELHDLLMDFIEEVIKHVAYEDSRLIPLVSKNTSVRFLMGRQFLKYRKIFKTLSSSSKT